MNRHQLKHLEITTEYQQKALETSEHVNDIDVLTRKQPPWLRPDYISVFPITSWMVILS